MYSHSTSSGSSKNVTASAFAFPLASNDFLLVSLTPSTLIAFVGSSVTFTCTAMVNVNISGITFQFDSSFMDNSSLTTTGSNEMSNNYTISPVNISSAGEYTCSLTVSVPGVCGDLFQPPCPSNSSVAVLTVLCKLHVYTYTTCKYVITCEIFAV